MAGGDVDHRDGVFGEGDEQGAGGDFQAGAAAVIVHGGDGAEGGAGFIAGGEADEIGQVELVVFGWGKDGAGGEEFEVGEALGFVAGGDLAWAGGGEFGELGGAAGRPCDGEAAAGFVDERIVAQRVGVFGERVDAHQAPHAVRLADDAHQDQPLGQFVTLRGGFGALGGAFLRLLLGRGLFGLFGVDGHFGEAGLAEEFGDAVGGLRAF